MALHIASLRWEKYKEGASVLLLEIHERLQLAVVVSTGGDRNSLMVSSVIPL
ncbi:MAG: hypothetical protein AAFQ89_03255 [Cyanobacteria bacterium J06626_18]